MRWETKVVREALGRAGEPRGKFCGILGLKERVSCPGKLQDVSEVGGRKGSERPKGVRKGQPSLRVTTRESRDSRMGNCGLPILVTYSFPSTPSTRFCCFCVR